MKRIFLALFGLFLATAAQAEGAVTIIHAGLLLAVPGSPAASEQSIIVRDGRIAEVRAGFVTEDGATVIDLSSSFVLPGLMDMHTHISSYRSGNPLADKLHRVEWSDADYALSAAANARKTLLAGFTTIRNLGSSGAHVFALRDAIKSGMVPGPRILDAGHGVGATGGHAGGVHGFREDVNELLKSTGRCDGPDSCRRAVRLQVKRGADVIKFAATGGVLSETAAGTDQQLTDAEMKAIVEAAHSLGRKVAAHAHGLDGINAALRAGVDSIEHGSFLDESSIKLFKQTGAYLVPTLMPPFVLLAAAKKPGNRIPPSIRDKILSVAPMKDRSVQRALKGGIKIAFGTDAGVYPHGQNAKEFELLVKAGMAPMDAITAATVNAADLAGLTDEAGTIEAGKAADIIAVAGNPLEDITELARVTFVMRGGIVHKRP